MMEKIEIRDRITGQVLLKILSESEQELAEAVVELIAKYVIRKQVTKYEAHEVLLWVAFASGISLKESEWTEPQVLVPETARRTGEE